VRVAAHFRFGILVLVLVLAAGCSNAPGGRVPSPSAPSAPSAPAWISDLGGRILFSREGGSPTKFAVFTMASDGSELAQVTDSTQSVTNAIWGPGTSFLFDRDRGDQPGVFSMDASGGSVTAVTTGPDAYAHAALSPNGTQMAYEAWTDSRDLGIQLAPVDGSTAPRLLTPPVDPVAGGDGQPAFSPDGRQVAFQRVVDHANEKAVRAALYVVGVDGTGLRQLTSDVMDAGHPRWSPDGRTILFHDNADMQGPIEGMSANLWTVAADGTGLTQLTHEAGGNYAIEGTWSPDSSAIAFASWFGDDAFTAIRVMHADGTDATPIWTSSFAAGAGNNPEWAASH